MPKVLDVAEIVVKKVYKRVCAVCGAKDKLRFIYPVDPTDLTRGELRCLEHREVDFEKD